MGFKLENTNRILDCGAVRVSKIDPKMKQNNIQRYILIEHRYNYIIINTILYISGRFGEGVVRAPKHPPFYILNFFFIINYFDINYNAELNVLIVDHTSRLLLTNKKQANLAIILKFFTISRYLRSSIINHKYPKSATVIYT